MPAPAQDAPVAAAPLERYVVELHPTKRANGAWSLANRDVGIIGAAPSLEGVLLDNLRAAGSKGHPQADNTANGKLDALVDLTPMRADWSAGDVPALFTRLRHALVVRREPRARRRRVVRAAGRCRRPRATPRRRRAASPA